MKNAFFTFVLLLCGQITANFAQTTVLPLGKLGSVRLLKEVNSFVYLNVWHTPYNQYSTPENTLFKFSPYADLLCSEFMDILQPLNVYQLNSPEAIVCGYNWQSSSAYPKTTILNEQCVQNGFPSLIGLFPGWVYKGDSIFFNPTNKNWVHYPDMTPSPIAWQAPVDGFSIFYIASENTFYAFLANTSGFQARTFNLQGELLSDWSVAYPQTIPFVPLLRRNGFTGEWLIHFYALEGPGTTLLISPDLQTIKQVPDALANSLMLADGYYFWATENSDSTIVSVRRFNLQGEASWKKYYLMDTDNRPDEIGSQIMTSAGKIYVGVTTNLVPFQWTGGTTWHGDANVLTTDTNFEGFANSLSELSSLHDPTHSLSIVYAYPNPIRAGQSLALKGFDLQTGASIRITNTDGKTMVNAPFTTPFILPGLPASGLYRLQVIQSDAVFSGSLFYLDH